MLQVQVLTPPSAWSGPLLHSFSITTF